MPGIVQRHQHPANAAGFTMIELIVAMTLFAIVLGVLSSVVFDAFQFSAKSAASTSAQSGSKRLMQQLTSDLQKSIAYDRDVARAPSLDQLREAVLYGNGTNDTSDYRDITYASPTRLWFRAQVIAELPGTGATSCLPNCTKSAVEQTPECIGYQLEANGDIVRYVYDGWQVCGYDETAGRPLSADKDLIQEKTLIKGYSPSGGESPQIFSYTDGHNLTADVTQ